MLKPPPRQPSIARPSGRLAVYLLNAGINTINTRSEFFSPQGMDTGLRQRIEAACGKGGASLFATGCSPGFFT
jgi:4-hydroxy-tetrahydrodipicolinate reductase